MSKRSQKLAASDKAMQVYRLFVRGWTTPEIASSSGVPLRTVQWIIQEADRITDGQIGRLNEEGVLRELYLGHRERKRTLWQLYTTARLEVVKVACLKQLVDEDERFETLAERLSVLKPLPVVRTQHDITYTEQKDLRLRVEVRYADDQLVGRAADLVGRLRRPGALDCAAPA